MRVSPGKSQLYGFVDGQRRGCVSGRERLTEADGGHLRAGVELELCSRHVCTSEACVFLGRLCTRSFVWSQNRGRNSSSHEIEQKKRHTTAPVPRAVVGSPAGYIIFLSCSIPPSPSMSSSCFAPLGSSSQPWRESRSRNHHQKQEPRGPAPPLPAGAARPQRAAAAESFPAGTSREAARPQNPATEN